MLTHPLLRGHLLGFLRRRPPLTALGAAGRPDAVLISHLHYDHLDVPSLRMLPVGTRFVAPVGSASFLERRGFHEVVELEEGEGVSVGGLRVAAVPAHHRRGGRPGAGKVGALGYVIEGDVRVYFAGDTALFDEMAAIGDRLDVALLPVWGWGPKLGPGHLDPVTAAESLRMLRPRMAIPDPLGHLHTDRRSPAMAVADDGRGSSLRAGGRSDCPRGGRQGARRRGVAETVGRGRRLGASCPPGGPGERGFMRRRLAGRGLAGRGLRAGPRREALLRLGEIALQGLNTARRVARL